MEERDERGMLVQTATEQPVNDADSERNLVGVFAVLLAVEKRLQKQGPNDSPPA